jgi:hypothetical protein
VQGQAECWADGGAAASTHLEAIKGRHLQQAVVLVHEVDLRNEQQSKSFKGQHNG